MRAAFWLCFMVGVIALCIWIERPKDTERHVEIVMRLGMMVLVLGGIFLLAWMGEGTSWKVIALVGIWMAFNYRLATVLERRQSRGQGTQTGQLSNHSEPSGSQMLDPQHSVKPIRRATVPHVPQRRAASQP
jgi:hypothetical protein